MSQSPLPSASAADPVPSAAGPAPSPGVSLSVTMAILGVSSLTVMANATIAPALPGLRDHFADTPGIETLAGLVVTLPSLFVVLTAGVVGVLADRMDRRMMVLVAMVLYGLGGASGLIAESMLGLLAGRVLLGLGVAGTMTVSSAYVGTLWHGAARERFTGLQVAAMNVGGIVFMTTGGLLAGMHWRAPFGIYLVALPIMVYSWVMLGRVPRRVEPGAAQPDGQVAHDAPFPWAAFFWVGPLAMLLMITFYALPTRLPFLLNERGIEDPLITGMILSCTTFASIPGALGYGRIRRYLSPKAIMSVGFLLMAAGIAMVALAPVLWITVAGVLLTGLPLGMMFPNFMAYFMGLVPPPLRGRASGLMTMAIFGGQFISPLVSAPLIHGLGLAQGMLAIAVLPLLAGVYVALTNGGGSAPSRPAEV